MTPTSDNHPHRQALAAAGATVIAGAAWWYVPHPLTALAIAFVPVGVWIIVRAPLLPVLGFVLFSFFRLHEVFPVLLPFKIPQLFAVAAITTLVWHVVLARDVQPFLGRELRLVLLMFITITLGIPFATNFDVSFRIWSDTYIKIGVMTFAIAWLLSEPRHFTTAMRVFVIAGIVVAIKALSNKIAGIDLVEETRVTIGLKLGSPLGDPNDLSLALLFPMSFAACLALDTHSKVVWRITALLGTCLMIAAIVATQSRGGLLGTAAVLAVFARHHIRSKVLLIGGGAAALLALALVAGVSERQTISAHENGLDASAQGRLNAWVAGFGMAVAHPLTGVGLGNFKGQYFYFTPEWTGKAAVAHSTWFEMMGDAGFVAFGFLATLVFFSVRVAFHLASALRDHDPHIYSAARALSAGLLGFVVSGTFLSQSFTWPLYIQVAMLAALHQLAQTRGYIHGIR